MLELQEFNNIEYARVLERNIKNGRRLRTRSRSGGGGITDNFALFASDSRLSE
jgi:hypothetical protein